MTRDRQLPSHVLHSTGLLVCWSACRVLSSSVDSDCASWHQLIVGFKLHQSALRIRGVHVPLTTFEGGLSLLHEVDDDVVIWLESTTTAALGK